MAGANDVAGSDNANPQLVIVFVHKLRCELRLTASSDGAFNSRGARLPSRRVKKFTAAQAVTPLRIIHLTRALVRGRLRSFFRDMKVCHITGSRAMRGSVIHRRGLAKKKGGVGRHITKMVPRIFAPNLRHQRIWVPELKKFVRVRVTARGLKTINKHGAYKVLKKAGAI